MRPAQLAAELGISPKTLRSWLRANHPRTAPEKGDPWFITPTVIYAARQHFSPNARQSNLAVEEPQDSEAQAPSHRAEGLTPFAESPMYGRPEVLATPCPVPQEPGVYGWWFKRMPTSLNVASCLVRDGQTLLYTGISPKEPAKNGRSSSQTLRNRISYHYRGNAEGSTLRKTLGVLLSNTLGIELRRVGSGTRMTFGAGEARLSDWMATNAYVTLGDRPATLGVGETLHRRARRSTEPR